MELLLFFWLLGITHDIVAIFWTICEIAFLQQLLEQVDKGIKGV